MFLISSKAQKLKVRNETRTDIRRSHRRCSVRKVVFINFAMFTGTHLGQSLLLNKVAGLRPFSQNTSGRLLLWCLSPPKYAWKLTNRTSSRRSSQYNNSNVEQNLTFIHSFQVWGFQNLEFVFWKTNSFFV